MGLNRRIITAVFCAAMVSVLGLPVGTAGATAFTCAGAEATIVGTSGDDELVGTDGPDVIVALGGNDVINAGAGDDIVCAGGGNDLVFGGPGDDTVRGGSGDDRLFGDSGDCIEDAGELEERLLQTRAFRCELLQSGGDDMLTGGNGDDLVYGEEGSDRVFGGPGDDLLLSGRDVNDLLATNHLWGGPGADRINAKGNNRIFGSEGDDRIVTYGFRRTNVTVFGGAGNDQHRHLGPRWQHSTPCCEPFDPGGALVRSYGGPGDDVLNVDGDGNVVYYGGLGNDTMEGNEDRLESLRAYGGPGDDVLGAPLLVGRLLLEGGDGDDFLAGIGVNGADATVRGGNGNDRLVGNDLVSGGDGDDQILGWGNGLFRGGVGNDEIIIDRGIATVEGNSGDDVIFEEPRIWEAGRKSAIATINGGAGSDACNGSYETHCEAGQDEAPFDTYPWVELLTLWYD